MCQFQTRAPLFRRRPLPSATQLARKAGGDIEPRLLSSTDRSLATAVASQIGRIKWPKGLTTSCSLQLKATDLSTNFTCLRRWERADSSNAVAVGMKVPRYSSRTSMKPAAIESWPRNSHPAQSRNLAQAGHQFQPPKSTRMAPKREAQFICRRASTTCTNHCQYFGV